MRKSSQWQFYSWPFPGKGQRWNDTFVIVMVFMTLIVTALCAAPIKVIRKTQLRHHSKDY
jgi:hypothetical protein